MFYFYTLKSLELLPKFEKMFQNFGVTIETWQNAMKNVLNGSAYMTKFYGLSLTFIIL